MKSLGQNPSDSELQDMVGSPVEFEWFLPLWPCKS